MKSERFGRKGSSSAALATCWQGANGMALCTLRSAIEEDYAKRLAKLAKTSLGKDEIGYVFLIVLLAVMWRS